MVPLWRNPRFWRIAGQLLAVVAVLLLLGFCLVNLRANLRQLGIEFGFSFLGSQASFQIGETQIPYQPSDSYLRALQVGLVNTLRVAVAGILLATGIGVTAGIARLSNNWLLRQLALVYVEGLRNLPLLLQLLFWYFAVFLRLPKLAAVQGAGGGIYFTQQGIWLPWLEPTAATRIWLVLLLLAIAPLLLLHSRRLLPGDLSLGVWILGALGLSAAIATGIGGEPILQLTLPRAIADQIQGGLKLSPEFSALLTGLSLYTGTFIAEIVRGGIQSVPQGQWEASQALGLKSGLALRLVILPQALRAIVPPLGNQYLNLAKNSSLAVAVGYPDLYAIASTTFNQTGRAVEVMLLIMVTYLSISLAIALSINVYNRSVQIVER